MEKSWNFEIGAKSHGKVMEFHKQILNSHESAPLHGSFSNPTNMYVNIESWNFVIRSWKSHGILWQRFRGNPA